MDQTQSFKSLEELRQHKHHMHLQYAQAFNTPQGELVLDDLIGFCGMDTDAFIPDNQYMTAYNLGMHKVVIYIKSMMEQTPQDLVSLTSKES